MTPARDVLTGEITVRRAEARDVAGIAALVASWSDEEILLPRDASEIALALDDFVVAVDQRYRVAACAALREYSPSLAELVSVAVAREAHGRGLGRLVVAQVERLALSRGHASLFAHTVNPAFFEAIGYERAERSLFPEKRARAHTACYVRELLAAPEILAAAA
jgi:amino-acid N-acetyltransferase